MGSSRQKNILVLARFIFTVFCMTWVHVGDASGRFPKYYASNTGQRTHFHWAKSQRSRLQYLEGVSLQDDYTDGICKTLVEPYGYPCQEYTVVTDDGFKLAVQQISYGSGGQPVFFQHGIMAGGESFLMNGPNESYAFILADLGFDVWIGNTRCVDWSHGHVSLEPSDPAYWDWSWDDVAQYDAPAMLQFVYSNNPQKLFYIGHSMGTTTLIAALISQATQLADIVRGAVLVCPVALMGDVTSNFDKVAARLFIDKVFALFGPAEFNLGSPVVTKLLDAVCEVPSIDCEHLLPEVSGNACCIDKARIPLYLKYYPQPSSTRTMAHFAQILRSKTFIKYDYGAIGNIAHYGQETPPVYELSGFPSSVPLLMVSGSEDSLADTEDVALLTQQLSQSVQDSIILPTYSHVDFTLSRTANVDVWLNVTSWLNSIIDS